MKNVCNFLINEFMSIYDFNYLIMLTELRNLFKWNLFFDLVTFLSVFLIEK